MEFRGITADGFVTFNISDCPIVLTETQVALYDKKCSGIIRKDSIARGDNGIFEGDTVYDEETGKVIGVVLYANGFKVQTVKGKLKKLSGMKHIKVGYRSEEDLKKVEHLRTPIRFYYKNSTVGFMSFIAKRGEKLILTCDHNAVNPEDIRLFTGYRNPETNSAVCFGDECAIGVVQMHKGDVCFKEHNGSYRPVTDMFKEDLK